MFNTKKRRILSVGTSRLENELEITKFLVKFGILWQKLKQDLTLKQKRQLRFGPRFRIKAGDRENSEALTETDTEVEFQKGDPFSDYTDIEMES